MSPDGETSDIVIRPAEKNFSNVDPHGEKDTRGRTQLSCLQPLLSKKPTAAAIVTGGGFIVQCRQFGAPSAAAEDLSAEARGTQLERVMNFEQRFWP